MNKFESVTKSLRWFVALLLVVFAAGCGSSSDTPSPLSSAKALTSFTVGGLVGTVVGTIDEPAKTIALTVPYNTDVTALVATFTTTGTGVTVGTPAVAQVSTTTANNFTSPVTYTVTAADGTTAAYTVTVIVASATTKAITAYSFAAYPAAPVTIDEIAKTIAVVVPYGTNVTALVATFTTTGASVSVASVAQVSGTTANNFTTSKAYLVTAGNSTTATYTVTVTAAANSAKAITAYSFVGYPSAPVTINEAAKTIAVTVPYGTTVTNLIATFTTTGTGVPTVAGVNQVSGTTPNNFTTSKAYLVTAANSTTATYTVTVVFAANTAKAITAYSFVGHADYPGLITEPAHTIAVTLPNGTVVTNLIASFTTTGAGLPTVAGVNQVSGTTQNDFTTSKAYLVTAADTTTATYAVTVTVAAAIANPTAPVLGEAGRYLILASQGITGGAGSVLTNGDIAVMDQARTYMTGFTATNVPADGLVTQLTGDTWVGEPSRSYAGEDANPTPFPAPLALAVPHTAYATTLELINQSRTDLGVAYTFLAADPNPGVATQVCATQLGNLTLTPGVYKTASNVSITTGTLNLDAQGDPNAIWIFSIDGTLTTGAPGGNIAFVGGVGSAKNVYWRVAGVTTIGADTIFYGNVFGNVNIDVLANANITGSLYSNTASVTLITNTVTKAP